MRSPFTTSKHSFRLFVSTAFLVIISAACSGSSSDPVAIRLVDQFQTEMVDGAPVEVPEPAPLAAWNFAEPAAQSESPAEALETRGWKAGTGVSGLKLHGGRLVGRSTTDLPIIYVTRTDKLDEQDLIHALEIRMRASKGNNLSISGNNSDDLNFEEITGMARGFPWPDKTPIVTGDDFQTYTLQLVSSVAASSFKTLLIRPTDVAQADFEIESIRLISRKEHLARIPSGVSWQGLTEIYHETLVSRAPESINMELELPENPWLDLSLGTVEYPPVTFRVRVADSGSDPVQGDLLLERTLTTPHRWESVPIDLAEYAGRQVALSLSIQAEAPGTLGFWGSPVVRDRGSMPSASRQEPPLKLAADESAGPPQGVILIIADTLRKDHLNLYGYGRETAPVVSRLAAEGALFRDNVAQGTWTKVSVPAIMTSLYPTSHRIVDFTDRLSASAVTIAEVFREAGYATLGYSSVLFSGKFTNLHQGFEQLHESGSVRDQDSSKTAREYVDRLNTWLEIHRDVPFFVFLHVFDPHDPYEPYHPYDALWADPARRSEHVENLRKVREVITDPLMKRFGMPSREELEKAGIDPKEFVSRDIDWYDGSIRGLDVEVARLQERLRSLGLAEKTLLVFTSDHGEEFHDHGRMFHGQSVYGELTGVPLIFYRPGVIPAGAVIDETVQSIDIMPTILALSQLEKPAGALGQSLLPLMAAAKDAKPGAAAIASSGQLRAAALADAAAQYGWEKRPAISEKAATDHVGGPPPRSTESHAIVLDGWKLIHNSARPEGMPEFELYDHAKDPLDQHDLAEQNPEVVQKLKLALDNWRKAALAAQLPEADSTEGLSREELERLRSLGYIQ